MKLILSRRDNLLVEKDTAKPCSYPSFQSNPSITLLRYSSDIAPRQLHVFSMVAPCFL
jgi:hypothetical protein